ncbi:MAG TPA: glycine cleavage system aminomethyltransferase GcvT [Acidobacteriota bacterium]|nr:glycine cleavage system aminomethyltransferase GcvT [Acidobacteriota bacterium]
MLDSELLRVSHEARLLNSSEIKKTPLNAIHRQLGGKMVNFAGWDMPVQYAGPIPEHIAVRTRAGIFDVSHMGEVEVKGPAALETIQHLTCNDAGRLSINQIQYSALTTPQGTFVDDILVYRMGSDHFFLCVNASNQEKDYQWIHDLARNGTQVLFRSNDFAQIAVQGPKALEILAPLTEIQLAAMKYYWFAQGKFAGAETIVSRTGYTGEDGFEIYCPPSRAESVWQQIMKSGKAYGLEPAGLAARNTLRLEAKMALYGNDIDDTTSVLEADLGWICKLEKGDFLGRSALLAQKQSGLERILVGFEVVERGIAREHYAVELNGKRIGSVTSGSPAPFLKKNIGLTYLPIDSCSVGTEFKVIIREKPVKARVVPTPFYKRTKSA